jgi:TRAP-type C4-dicarboxylate transport system permease small subunit
MRIRAMLEHGPYTGFLMSMSLLKVLDYICSKISMLSLVVMAGITFADVFGRVFFNSPIGFAYEVVGICLAVCFYSGLYHVHKKRKHVKIDLLEKIFKGRTGIFLAWFSYIIEVVFFSALVYMVYIQAKESRLFGDVFMFLGLEKWIILAVMAGFAMVALISLLVVYPDNNQE